MKFDVLTLFPDMISAVAETSILKRAQQKGLITVNAVDIRNFSLNKHHKVDDYPYGGGHGMVMSAEPVVRAYESCLQNHEEKPFCIYLSPQGEVLTQKRAQYLSVHHKHLILLCGHYEGVDERAIDEIVDMEISMGDFILTGGELPALTLIDTISRCIDGVLGARESYLFDSFSDDLLEAPSYTRPPVFRTRPVPDVLLSGNHEQIERWRHEQALLQTWKKRPDLLEKRSHSPEDLIFLKKIQASSKESL